MAMLRTGGRRFSGSFRAGLIASLLACLALAACVLRANLHAQAAAYSVQSAAAPGQSAAQSTAANATDAPSRVATANDPHQEISQLLQMATDLKNEVNKSNQDVLSISVVRKAAEIEQLAHKMRLSGGGK